MKAVWSFWSKPFFSGRKAFWASELHHWLAWVLSLETARRHYPETVLYTDSRGAEILIDRLGLHFDAVSTALDALDDSPADWWALGKIHAYSQQKEPFVHIDSDVFLWKRLPESLESADVFAQNPEPFTVGSSCYRPERIEAALLERNGWLPEEWLWYRQSQHRQRGECCGIFGGSNTAFIRHYAEQAMQLAQAPQNTEGWTQLGDKSGHMIVLEQYLLAACVDFHRMRRTSSVGTEAIRYLFGSLDEAFDPRAATAAGYTHLLADAKKNPTIAANLEKRVEREFPEQFERCRLLSRNRGP